MIQGSGRDQVLPEVRCQFNHQFLKLLDAVIVFNDCCKGQLKAVARLRLGDMATALAKRGVTRYASDAALSIIANRAVIHFRIRSIKTPLYIDSLVGTNELSFSLEKSRVLVDDLVFKQFKEPTGDLRIMYRKEREIINQIYQLSFEHWFSGFVCEVMSCLKEVAELIMRKRDKESVQGLGMRLRKRMVGKHQAIDFVTEAVLRSIDAPLVPHQPAGSFLFLDQLVRIHRSTFTSTATRFASRVFKCSSHESGLPLLEAVRRRLYSVLLFDQVEKAHLSVFSTLLWMLDHGKLTDSHGRTVDFRNTSIIMVSDLGNKIFLAKLFGHSSLYSVRDRIIQQKCGNRYLRMLYNAVRNLSQRFLQNGTSCKNSTTLSAVQLTEA
ncbi:hypothetical protein HHK36_006651 [Tetracentron sinense]|uniref:ATPase AAA-type core domain-containing protein n=1 Tax=Tetracentron sinense TaxID=13715 RepID=A0A834ZJE1_TETSI|nr:hypothetical protein HHK36_006651 [Tetracentron sinense]